MGFVTIGSSVPKIGVLGASRIVRAALLDEAAGLVDVAAVAARDLSRAQSYAADHGIPRAYGSYEELIDAPDIDLIYNALPASGHAPWSVRALEAGKHVLCEKPFGLHVDEARQCVAVALREQRLLMEAHHWRYHPLAEHFAAALGEHLGAGEPVEIEAQFRVGLEDPGDIRFNPALGPGVLMDFGCYTIQWTSFAAEALSATDVAAIVVSSRIEEGEPGVDMKADVELAFGAPRELSARFSCDMTPGLPFRAFVRATCGPRVVHWENPLGVEGSWLAVTEGERELSRHEPEGPTTYGGQLRAFLHALRSGEPPLTSGERIVSTQKLLDDCYATAGCISRRDLRRQALGS